jgi:oligoendopeptidase F
MSTNIKQRSEIPDKYKWDIEDMYASDEQWEADLKDGLTLADQLSSYEGRLGEDAQTLLAALKLQGEAWQKLERVFVYARMRRDEDNRVEKYQSMADRAMAALAQASANTAFFTPELLSYEKEDILRMTDELDELKIYRFMLEDTFRQKEHVLSAESENLLAQMSEVTQATSDIFTMLNNADIKFGTITDEDGNKVEMSHGNYIKFMQSKDRSVRKAAYEAMYNAFSRLINTIASNYNYNTKNDVISARIRKYPSARSAALSGDNIPDNVYDSLVGYNDNLTPGEPEIITAEKLDTYLSSTDGFKPYKDYLLPTRLIQATGTLLKVSTEQYDLLIEGTENRLTIFSPEASTLESAASLVGQQVTLTGYIIKTANEHAVSVMQTSLGLFLSE